MTFEKPKASPWREINTIRKSGDLDAAESLARAALREFPHDVFLKNHVAFVFYDRLKQLKARCAITGNKIAEVNPAVALAFEGYLRDYAKMNAKRPDIAHSLILQVTLRVGRFLPHYGGFLRWSTWSAFGDPEDFLSLNKDGKRYPSLCTSIAREGVAWALSRDSLSKEDENYIVGLAERAFERDPTEVYLAWDLAKLFRRRDDASTAFTYIKHVLRSRADQYWVWSEAGRIAEASSDGELAIACYCRALTSKASDDFLSPTRVALANLLFRSGYETWAMIEASRAKRNYQRNDWQVPPELIRLEKLGATLAAEVSTSFNPERACREKAKAVQVLFFDRVETVAGCFVNFDDGLGRPRYAYMTSAGSKMLLGQARPDADLPAPGTPMFVRVGYMGTRAQLIDTTLRPEAARWDCLTPMNFSEEVDNISIRHQVGVLRVLPQGFGFVGDTFIGPDFINRRLIDGQDVELIAIRKIDKKKGLYTWKACYVSAGSS